ncbi:Six-hairpin glycosidase-like protein [Halteromyces radiatus]|uniref:Six-hairpin glycosidase-like protein n=1 Tax=Halteromyces radiatus TaxID=101107 RepID=UPI00221F67C7|nr:Six-hairpin glycosidase-like protein [Halteromyces radiatus]KAI8100064.1 Six-hairpin glycosidase-like protein [Halteromyces radiatus]
MLYIIPYYILLSLVVLSFSSSVIVQQQQVPFRASRLFDSNDNIQQQYEQSLGHLLKNFNPSGTRRGFFAASPSKSKPDYFYSWTRDASLVSNVLVTLQQHNQLDLKQVLFDYIDFQVHTQRIVNRTVCQCLGEPKFNMDGSPFLETWGRPQNDGPAERAITMILFAKSLQEQTSSNKTHDLNYITSLLKPSIYLDLDYVVKNWNMRCFDLWEEIKGIHFFTLMVMRKGLLDGSDFALKYGDIMQAHLYRHTARQIQDRLETFWSSQDGYIRVTQDQVQGQLKPSGLDTSIILAANLISSLNDGFFTPGSDKVLATAKILEDTFDQLYPINKEQGIGEHRHHGVAMGRYPEDRYDGYGTSMGNPWFLTTAAMAELYYLAMMEWYQQGWMEVNDINHAFFRQRDKTVSVGHVYRRGNRDFDWFLHTLASDADRFFATIQYHQAQNGVLSEQFNRFSGFQQGAPNLSWSYSSLISALNARTRFYRR